MRNSGRSGQGAILESAFMPYQVSGASLRSDGIVILIKDLFDQIVSSNDHFSRKFNGGYWLDSSPAETTVADELLELLAQVEIISGKLENSTLNGIRRREMLLRGELSFYHARLSLQEMVAAQGEYIFTSTKEILFLMHLRFARGYWYNSEKCDALEQLFHAMKIPLDSSENTLRK